MNAFWEGFEKRANKEVASVAVLRGDKILMGKRRDNQKWTTPGGHLEKGETPVEGAVRELYEEAGIRVKPSLLKRLTSMSVHTPEGKILRVHGYSTKLRKEVQTSMKQDPDNEVYRWHWMKFRPFKQEIANNMHVPKDDNVLWKGIGATMPKAAARANVADVAGALKKAKAGTTPRRKTETYGEWRERIGW